LSQIDGDGTTTFTNASVAADVFKAGVFGANGVLNVGGGTLSANTTLELYATGSNGQLNFVSDVTLGGNSLKYLAANSVTIFNSVTVTIGGPNAANVYTNNANYSGFGGNGSTTGTFAGAGANPPQPLSSAPPFGPVHPTTTAATKNTPPTAPTAPKSTRTTGTPINISDTDQLLAMLDNAAPGSGGKVTSSGLNRQTHPANSRQTNVAAARSTIDRSATDVRPPPGAVMHAPQ
jgi:hypothetical protein